MAPAIAVTIFVNPGPAVTNANAFLLEFASLKYSAAIPADTS